MANRIIAVDLGAWSVKIAIAQPGLRHATLSSFHERSILDGDEPWEARASRALAQLAREVKIDHDNVYLAVPGDHVFTHVLEFPFKTLRRADLEKAVGAELENVVPVDLENMVYAFETLPPDPAPAAASGEPGAAAELVRGRVAAPSSGMRVLTYAMALDRAQAWLKVASDAGAPARSLVPEAGPMARLVDRLPSLAAARAAGAIAVVDVGHARTDVVVVRASRAVYARTVSRGGKHLTEAVAKTWRLPWAEAEQAKHTDGFIASAAMPATSEAWARVSEVMQGELQAMLRELRQTFAACRAKTGTTVTSVLLVGGGSRLRGMPAWLGEQLGVPVATIDDADGGALLGRMAGQVSAESSALCLGILADAESARPLLDLRSGALAHRVDLTFLRAKAPQLALAATLITAAATTSAWFAHSTLRKAERILVQRVAEESTVEFGDPKTADDILASATGQVTEMASPLPKMTAWDILLDLSQRMPARDKVTLDVELVEIDATKVVIKGTAKSPDEVDAVETALKAQTCFEEVNRGATQATADGKRQFEFTIKSGCM
jgi:Tfp pilus assembly PilM family ATPase